jgi:protein-tyrosine-phosphatase
MNAGKLSAGIGILMVAIASTAGAQPAKSQTETTASTIVFVCEHGAAKSVIAAAHFNRLVKEKGLPYRAISRGVNPDAVIAPAVRSGLSSEGLDVSTWRPTAISDDDIQRAERIVSLATGLPAAKPAIRSKLLEWNDIPSTQNYSAARAAIVRQVEDLVEKLAVKEK